MEIKKRSTALYNLCGMFYVMGTPVDTQTEDVLLLEVKYPNEYNLIRNRFVDQILEIIQSCDCSYMTIDTIDAHKWMIRDRLKHDKPKADKIISDIFSHKEEQRIHLASIRKLLILAIDGFCYLSLTNYSRHMNVCINMEFDAFISIPDTFDKNVLDWEYIFGHTEFRSKLSII